MLKKLSKVRLADIGHVFMFLAAIIPALIMKRSRRALWLICEYGCEARDNGYSFYKYLRSAHPEVDAVYAIDKRSNERGRVESLGEVINYGSLRHWVYYLAAQVNISSQKGGKPNAAVCYLLEVVLGILKNKRVFLQHGVTKDDLPFLHYNAAKLSMFCCAALPEYEFVKRVFEYPEGVVRYTGFCRFDDLHSLRADNKLLIIMPTWRAWLYDVRTDAESFAESEYFKRWSELLMHARFAELLRRHELRAVFCPHRNIGALGRQFTTASERVELLTWDEADVSGLLHGAGVLITDFSSVAMDFAYMKRPLIYYQFDRDRFREEHLPEGYFDYDRDGFGQVCTRADDVVEALERVLSGADERQAYLDRVDSFYTLWDDRNCERTFEAIADMLNGGKSVGVI
ncbi:MAG: CDP-glycerol glycerophosphotransferase family protein [Clostridia bacterium]|nr:CDP-glycerol glycerophosphotransferase family protein [Clostridia bacterium]